MVCNCYAWQHITFIHTNSLNDVTQPRKTPSHPSPNAHNSAHWKIVDTHISIFVYLAVFNIVLSTAARWLQISGLNRSHHPLVWTFCDVKMGIAISYEPNWLCYEKAVEFFWFASHLHRGEKGHVLHNEDCKSDHRVHRWATTLALCFPFPR